MTTQEQVAALLLYANDEAVRQEWQAGRVTPAQELPVCIPDPAMLQQLGTNCFTVYTQLPADPEHVLNCAALAAAGSSSSSPFQPWFLLAPHNSKPNSGVLQKQPLRTTCHSHHKAALSYDFSGITNRFQPQPVTVSQRGDTLQGPPAQQDALQMAPEQQVPYPAAAAAAAGDPIGPDNLCTIRIEGTCTITYPPAEATVGQATQPSQQYQQDAGATQLLTDSASQAAQAAVGSSSTGTGTTTSGSASRSSNSSAPPREVMARVVRWLTYRKKLPDDILQLQQQQLAQLRSFRKHEREQKQRLAEAKARGEKFTRKTFNWKSPPLWWVPYDLFVPGTTSDDDAHDDVPDEEREGWVGGIALYEFTGQLATASATKRQQMQGLPQQQAQAWAQQQGQALAQQQMEGLPQQQVVADAAAMAAGSAAPGSDHQALPPRFGYPQGAVGNAQPLFVEGQHMNIPLEPMVPGGMDVDSAAAAVNAAGSLTTAALDLQWFVQDLHPGAEVLHPWQQQPMQMQMQQRGELLWQQHQSPGEMLLQQQQQQQMPPCLMQQMQIDPTQVLLDPPGYPGGPFPCTTQKQPAPGQYLPLMQHQQQQHQQQQHPGEAMLQPLLPPQLPQQQMLPLPPSQQQQQQLTASKLSVPPEQSSTRHQKQQYMEALQVQLQQLQLQQRQIQQQLAQTQQQQPCVSLQQCSRRMQQLNATYLPLKLLLLAVCAGHFGDHSAMLFEALLQEVQRHNERVAEAAVDGVVGVDKLAIELLSLKESVFGRTLLHLLVSEFPMPRIAADGSPQLATAWELLQHVTKTSTAAAAAGGCGSGAALAAATAVGGGSGADAGGAPNLSHPDSLQQVLSNAQGAVDATAAAATAAAGSSSSSCSSQVGTLPTEQRMELLRQLRQAAVGQGRWQEVLNATNKNGVPAWLTACHWCVPEVIDFFLSDEEFDLRRDMLHPTPNGRLFYHVICREARNRTDKTRHRRALTMTLTALARKLSAPTHCNEQQGNPSLPLLQQHQQVDVPGSWPGGQLHTGGTAAAAAPDELGIGLTGVFDSGSGSSPCCTARSWWEAGGHQHRTQDAAAAAAGAAAAQLCGASATTATAAAPAWLLPGALAVGEGSTSILDELIPSSTPVLQRHSSAPAGASAIEALSEAPFQDSKRQKLTSTAAAAAARLTASQQQQQQLLAAVPPRSSSAPQASSLSALWPHEVLQELQLHIFHTDKPSYDVAMLERQVQELFGFGLCAPRNPSR